MRDRGFLLGDGVFETLRVENGRVWFYDRHLQRLRHSLATLDFIEAETPLPDFLSVIHELVRRNNLAEGIGAARITVTRGASQRGLMFAPAAGDLTFLVTLVPYQGLDKAPKRLLIAQSCRSSKALSSHHKTVGYLENIMARGEATKQGVDDALMLNEHGRVVCASAANIFLLQPSGKITTPPLEEGALPGIMRAVVLEAASAADIDIETKILTPASLAGGSIILTNSLMLLARATLDAPWRTEANGMVNELTALIRRAYEQELDKKAGELA